MCDHPAVWAWLSTGVRSVDHCVETLCSLQTHDKADLWARRRLQKLIPGLLQSKRAEGGSEQLHVWHACQLGVVEAMCAVSNGVPLGASHAIGHQLGPLGVGHGETSCILLPAVCKFNAKYGANVPQQDELGMPRTLEDVKVGRERLPMLAKNSLHDIWIQTNAVSITEKAQVTEILEMVAQ